MANSKQNTPMTPDAASRIQSSEAKANGGGVSKDSFTSRAQRAATKNSSTDKK